MKKISVILTLSIIIQSLSAQEVDSIIDIRDDRVYNIVKIGEQWWMQENLDAGVRVNNWSGQPNNGKIEKYCYDDLEAKCDTFGGLYTWEEMMAYHFSSVDGNPGTIQGVCPIGWHLPTDSEWTELTDYLGGLPVAGGKLKESSSAYWDSPNTGATNESGFTALPGGYHHSAGFFNEIHNSAYWWSTTEFDGATYYNRYLAHNTSVAYRSNYSSSYATSVRCLSDASQISYLNLSDLNMVRIDSLHLYSTRLRDTILLINSSARENVSVSSIYTDTPGFSLSEASTSLTPGDSIYLVVSFNPIKQGWQYDTMHILSDDPFQPHISLPLNGYTPITDSILDIRDSKVYDIVRIGAEWWFQENLDLGIKIDGTQDASHNNIIEKYYYQDKDSLGDIYGGLYQWDEAMNYYNGESDIEYTVQGICPPGWSLPLDYPKDARLSNTAFSAILKENGTEHWEIHYEKATNESGFTGLPGGIRWSNYSFSNLGSYACFWTAQRLSGTNSVIIWLRNSSQISELSSFDNKTGASIRCVRDSSHFSSFSITDMDFRAASEFHFSHLKLVDTIILVNSNLRETINIHSIYTDTPQFQSSRSSVLIAPGDSAFLVVSVDPKTDGYYADTIHFETDDPFTPEFSIALKGNMQITDTIIDIRDGQEYNVVKIGKQWWMSENLNIGTRIEKNASSISNDTIEKYCYANDHAKCDTFGGLYSWFEAMDYYPPEDGDTGTVQGICPPNWHIPTQTEWEELKGFLGGFTIAGGKMKARGTEFWGDPNEGATNESGFTGLPVGRRSTTGTFGPENQYAYLWSATQTNPSDYRYYSLSWHKTWLTTGSDLWSYGHSVRCLCDSNRFSLLSIADQNMKTVSEINLSADQPEDTIVLINTGKENTISISWISNRSYDFQFNRTSALLLPGDTILMAVKFTPTGIGHFTDSIKIESDDPYRPVLYIPLSAYAHYVDSITDHRDGQTYKIVNIKGEWWMQENLNIGTQINYDQDGSDNGIFEKKCYNDLQANCETFGGLYQWDEAMDYNQPDYAYPGTTQGICPLGWHLPTWSELDSLVVSIGPVNAGGKMKEISNFHWKLPNTGATNESGFTALPSGVHENQGNYIYLGEEAQYWTSYAWRSFNILYNENSTVIIPRDKMDANAIRCKRDPGPMSHLSVRDQELKPVTGLNYYHPKTADTILLLNSGAGQTLNISSINSTGTIFSSNKSTASVAPGDSIMLVITFNPPDTAIYYDTLTILSNDPYMPEIKISLLGTFPPGIEWTEVNHISCKGFNDGSVRISPILGEPPYEIGWFGSSMWDDSTYINMLPDYEYWVDITDAGGWKVRDTIVLSEPDTMLVAAVYSDTICLNSSNGFIDLSPSGGITPYSYSWSNGESTASLFNLESGDYQVVVSDNNGCKDTSDYTIHSLAPYEEEEICVVTVDLFTGNNTIVWESTPDKGIDHYNVYREDDLIGTVPFGNLSIFKDTIADPETRPFVYTITAVDTCGNESGPSPYHKPLFLQYVSSVDGVNLRWSNYVMEGGEVTFENYAIYRGSDSLSLSPFALNIPTIVDVYTDNDPAALENKYYYRVAGILTDPCTPTGSEKAGTGPYQHTLSNMDDNKIKAEQDTTGTDTTNTMIWNQQAGEILIYPNPFSDHTTLEFPNNDRSEFRLYMYDMMGRMVFMKHNIRENQVIIRRRDLKAGYYTIELKGPRLYRGNVLIQ